ncbi:MAG: D-glucuronyl C5-epimerase family protein [Solirubrobacterales bacterium]
MKLSPTLRNARLAVALALSAVILLLATGRAEAATVSASLTKLQNAGLIDPAKASSARKSYHDARSLRKRLSGSRQLPLTNQIRTIEALAKKNRITADRVTPLFTQLQVNTDWFRTKGPGSGDLRFGESLIIYRYFAGWGWMFHPLANFSKVNANWTQAKSVGAQRGLNRFTQELITWGVNRGGALTWEYYFPFAGSPAPFISSISQGTAIQALARAGKKLKNQDTINAATAGARAFGVAAPTGLKISRDGGLHFLGYSGNRSAIIFNMFAQGLDGLHDYEEIVGDPAAKSLYEQGLVAARVELPQSDTGAWSNYQLGGVESNLNYHKVLIEFLVRMCEDTQEATFCGLHDRLSSYMNIRPTITGISKKVRNGRIYVTFSLSKVSTITVRATGGGTSSATVYRGKRVFSVKKGSSSAVTINAKDLAGNTAQVSK